MNNTQQKIIYLILYLFFFKPYLVNDGEKWEVTGFEYNVTGVVFVAVRR